MSNTSSISQVTAPDATRAAVQPPADAGFEPPAGAPTAAELASLVDHLRVAERHIAAAVGLAGRLAGSGVCEQVEGLPLEHFLGLASRLTGADRRMLVAAGEVLADLPVTARLFAQGALSWGQARAIVAAARRLRRADRAMLDARLAATVADRGNLDGFDPDQLVDAVHAAVEQLHSPRERQRSEDRRRAASFLTLQAGFDGGVRVYGEFDPLLGASVVNALDAAAGPPTPDHAKPHTAAEDAGTASGDDAGTDGEPPTPDHAGDDTDAGAAGDAGDAAGGADGDHGEGAAAGGWSPSGRARQYAAALGRICAAWLGGGSGRTARPLFVAHVDTGQARAHPDGTIELAVRGGLSRISAATLEQLATDADLRAVLFDGARPLAVSNKRRAGTIPAATRRAVAARDQGCRFPGSADPLAHTDIHHLTPRALGGDHHPDNLVALSRRYHTLTHRCDWTLTLNPATGEVTARRGRRNWHSLPRATGLSPLPDADRAPPHLPF